MKEINVGGLVNLINQGFDGEVVFTADVKVHGSGTPLLSYGGEVYLRRDDEMNDAGRYILTSRQGELKIMFRKSGEATIAPMSEGALRIVIPFVSPDNYGMVIDNFRDGKY